MADAEATSTMTLAVHAVDAVAMVAVSAFVLHLTMFSAAPGSLGEGRGVGHHRKTAHAMSLVLFLLDFGVWEPLEILGDQPHTRYGAATVPVTSDTQSW